MKSSAIIERFTADLLTHGGAIVEPAGRGLLDVMPGPDLRRTLGLGEYQRLAFEPGAAGDEVVLVDYDAPLVERMGAVIAGLGKVSRAAGPPVRLKPIDVGEALDRGVTLQNGVFRYKGHVTVEALYAGFVFEYTLLADERMGGLACVWINPATRSTARLESRFDLAALSGVSSGAHDLTGWGGELPWALGIAAGRAIIGLEIGDFLDRLQRRREREARRLREYYEEIDLEIRRKLAGPRMSDDSRRRERDRLAATHGAYLARRAEVADRYRVRLHLLPIGVLLRHLPAYRISVRLMRRSASVDAAFSWNPLDGRIEPRACDGCLGPVSAAAWLCDESVHYVCEGCLSPCGECGRRYCRACTQKCPRRHDCPPDSSRPLQVQGQGQGATGDLTQGRLE